MEDNEIFATLKTIVSAVAQTFGPTCEVAVCDLRINKVVAIENGHVTGRKVGSSIAKKVSEYYINCDKNYHGTIVYPSHSIIDGRLLKCSSVVIPNSKGEPIAIFSINIDMDSLKLMSDTNSLMTTIPLMTLGDVAHTDERIYHSNKESEPYETEDHVENVAEYTKKLMSDIICKIGKPLPLTTKSGRMMILRELDKQGVFLVRDIVPSVCEILCISQATLYNYLREIHNETDKNLQGE